MPVRFASFAPKWPSRWSLQVHARRILLLALVVMLYALGFAYHSVIMLVGAPASATMQVAYDLAVLGCYGLLFYMLSQHFEQNRSSPLHVFWSILLTGALILAAAFLVPMHSATGDFDPVTSIPLNMETVVKLNVLSMLEALFGFVLLLRLRDLALFKRSASSVRNWYLMLGLMLLASLSMLPTDPLTVELNVIAIVFAVLAVGLMVVNSFRLSWIVYLTFREKLATIGLCLTLLVLLLYGVFEEATGFYFAGGSYAFARVYSYPLNLFVTLSIIFGILYCLTTFLSLLFHLPTTEAFQKKAGELAAMHSLTRLVSQVFELDKLASTIAASPVEAGTAQAAWLSLIDHTSGSLRPQIVTAHNITPARIAGLVDTAALRDDAFARRQAILLNNAAADHRIRARPGDGIGSLIAVPLIARDEPLGVLFVTKEVALGFESDDLETIATFADQAALALDNSRLFQQRIETERLSRELSIAREVQQKLLPQKLPVLDGLAIAASSTSAQEVGGDYYDFVRIGEDCLGIIIGDVSGKGTSAAFYMAELQGIFQALSRMTCSPSDFLIRANQALASTLEKNTFISVVYGILDLEREEFALARAGHCPVAVSDHNGQARLLRSRGLGLGLDRGKLFGKFLTEERLSLKPGDTVVLYTDGLVESRNEAGEEYGYDRLTRALEQHHALDAGALHDALLKDLNAFIGHNQYDDDLTLVVLKWHGRPQPSTPAVLTQQQNADVHSTATPQ